MPPRGRRPQASDATLDDDQRRPLVVRPLVQTDRVHNAHDIEVDVAAIASGMEHGGSVESRAARLQVRGGGGRKRTGTRAPQRRIRRDGATKKAR